MKTRMGAKVGFCNEKAQRGTTGGLVHLDFLLIFVIPLTTLKSGAKISKDLNMTSVGQKPCHFVKNILL